MPPPRGRIRPESVAAALSEKSSRAVIAACMPRGRSAKEVADATSLPLTTVYRQLHRLVAMGLLVVERSAITPEGRRYDVYRSRLREAHLDVGPVGERVRYEPDERLEERMAEPWSPPRADAGG